MPKKIAQAMEEHRLLQSVPDLVHASQLLPRTQDVQTLVLALNADEPQTLRKARGDQLLARGALALGAAIAAAGVPFASLWLAGAGACLTLVALNRSRHATTLRAVVLKPLSAAPGGLEHLAQLRARYEELDKMMAANCATGRELRVVDWLLARRLAEDLKAQRNVQAQKEFFERMAREPLSSSRDDSAGPRRTRVGTRRKADTRDGAVSGPGSNSSRYGSDD